ncbi:MAG TPA: aminomethyltransferase family protein [Steroidobacteraceae bacterium]
MKLTPLYDKHRQLGATLYTTGTGYQMPSFYRSANEEACAVRERVGMIDLSLMSRLDLKGRDALPLAQRLVVNNVARLQDGQALYSTMCDERGLIVDDVVVMRFAARHVRIITSSMFRQKTAAWIRRHMADLEVYLTDVSSGLAMIGVQGPRSRELLRALTDIDLDRLGFFRFASGMLAKLPCLIARLGFSGELGYECYVHTEDGAAAWEAIAAAGRTFAVVPYGMDTLDLLRLEKGFIFFGYDVTHEENPYECGLWPLIRYDCGDFIGREALLGIKARGPAKKLKGLEVGGDRAATGGQPLACAGQTVGRIVAGFHSPTLKRNLAYAYLDAPHFENGTQVSLEINGVPQKALVVEMPFFDPDGTRMRS